MLDPYSKEALTPPEASVPHARRIHALAERQGDVDNWNTPDFESINSAWDHADAFGLVPHGAGRVSLGEISSLDAMIGCANIEDSQCAKSIRDYVKHRGDTRSKLMHGSSEVVAGKDLDDKKYRLRDRLEDLDRLKDTVLAEINDVKRPFMKGEVVSDPENQAYVEWTYIDDDREIEIIREKERASLALVLDGMRVEIFETSKRTRGYPGKKHANDVATNTYGLRHVADNENNRLLKSLIDDLRSRTSSEPGAGTVARIWSGFDGAYEKPGWTLYVERELGFDPDVDRYRFTR